MDVLSNALDGIKVARINAVCQTHGIEPNELVKKEELVSVGNDLKEQLEFFKEYIGELMFDKIVAGGSLMPALDRWTSEVTESNVTKIATIFYKKVVEHDSTIKYEDAKMYILYLMQIGASGTPE